MLSLAGSPARCGLERDRAELKLHQNEDGGFGTYRRGRFDLFPAVSGYYASTPCVTATAALALRRLDHAADRPAIAAALNYLRRTRRRDGGWASFWWDGETYATAVALALFCEVGAVDDVRVAGDALPAAGPFAGADGRAVNAFLSALEASARLDAGAGARRPDGRAGRRVAAHPATRRRELGRPAHHEGSATGAAVGSGGRADGRPDRGAPADVRHGDGARTPRTRRSAASPAGSPRARTAPPRLRARCGGGGRRRGVRSGGGRDAGEPPGAAARVSPLPPARCRVEPLPPVLARRGVLRRRPARGGTENGARQPVRAGLLSAPGRGRRPRPRGLAGARPAARPPLLALRPRLPGDLRGVAPVLALLRPLLARIPGGAGLGATAAYRSPHALRRRVLRADGAQVLAGEALCGGDGAPGRPRRRGGPPGGPRRRPPDRRADRGRPERLARRPRGGAVDLAPDARGCEIGRPARARRGRAAAVQ